MEEHKKILPSPLSLSSCPNLSSPLFSQTKFQAATITVTPNQNNKLINETPTITKCRNFLGKAFIFSDKPNVEEECCDKRRSSGRKLLGLLLQCTHG